MTRVGIPRGLFYHYYYPLWKTFFQDLGAEVVLSAPTNRQTVEKGIEAAVDEACFPIKVYYGHVRELCRPEIDYIFLPRIVSVEPRSYICPKFMGIPDMLRASGYDLPPLIDMLVDLSKGERWFRQEISRVGRIFTRSNRQIEQAYRHGLEELRKCRHFCREGYTSTEAIRVWEGEKISLAGNSLLNIGVLGHGYSLYDSNISMNLIDRLRNMGCRVHLVEMLDRASIEEEAARIPKRVFWTLGRLMVGSALYMEKKSEIDGLIYLCCFGCGPDSLIGSVIENKVKNKPLMILTVDEHTGEGGLVTRLEAFCDMLLRKGGKQYESNLSTYG